MGDAVKEKTGKPSFFKGLKAEFNKIIWPAKDTIMKSTVMVLVVSLALGLLIGILDLIIKYGLNLVL